MTERAKFTYSLLKCTFEKQATTTEDQGKKGIYTIMNKEEW